MPGEADRYKPYRVDEEAGRHIAQEKAEKYGGGIEGGNYTTGRAGDGIFRASGTGESGRAAIRRDRSVDYQQQLKSARRSTSEKRKRPAERLLARALRKQSKQLGRAKRFRRLARGGAAESLQQADDGSIQSRSVAAAARTPEMLRKSGRAVVGAARFGGKSVVFVGRTAVGAVKFAAKAPKRIYSFTKNTKASVKRMYAQIRQQMVAAAQRRRAAQVARAGIKILPLLLGAVVAMAPIFMIVAQIPTITLKSTDEELNKVYQYITELDADKTRELRALPTSSAYQTVEPSAVRFFINGRPALNDFELRTDADAILKYLDAKYQDYAFDKVIYGLFGGTNVKGELEEIHKTLYSYTTQMWAEDALTLPAGNLGDPLSDIDPEDAWWYNANAIYSVFSVYLQEGLGYSKAQSETIIAGALGKIQAESGLDPSQIEGFSTERCGFSATLTPQKWALFESERKMDGYFHGYLQKFQRSNRLISTASSKYGRVVYAAPADANPDVNTWGYMTSEMFFCGGLSYFQWTGDQALQYLSFCKTNGLKWWTPEGALVYMFTPAEYGGDLNRIERVINDGLSWHDSIGGVETVSGQLAQQWLDRLQHPDRVCSMATLNASRQFYFSDRVPGNWTLDYDFGRRILNKAASIRALPAAYSEASIFRTGDETFVETPGATTPVAAEDLPYKKISRVSHLDVFITVKSFTEEASAYLTNAEADAIDMLDAVGMYTLKHELGKPFAGDDTWTVSRRWGKWCNGSTIEMHDGIDIRQAPGTPVQCVKTGVVQAINAEDGHLGNTVTIKLGEVEVVYGNMGEISVAAGETIPAGSVIGTVGAKSYLHLEYRRADKSVNPLFYLAGYYQSSGEEAGGTYTQAQQDIVDMALAVLENPSILPAGSYNGCAAFVAAVYREAGYHDEGRNAINYWSDWQASGGTSRSVIPVGALVVSAAGGDDGQLYGHVGIYIGNGEVIHYSGRIWKHSFANFLGFCGGEAAVTVNGGQMYVGYQGYVWPDGNVLGTYADATGC